VDGNVGVDVDVAGDVDAVYTESGDKYDEDDENDNNAYKMLTMTMILMV